MKAVIHEQYGPPEVANLKEVAKPEPGPNEVLVKVFASTVNRTDCGFRSAEYFVSRFWSGLFKPRYQILGCEFAGEIEATGANVKSFSPGDHVFGYDDDKFGGHAEYLAIDENKAIARMPDNWSYEAIVPSTEGAHYALCNIRASKITKGQKALIYGATGAIGSSAVQLLKHFKINVTAVCDTQHVDLIKSLGANEVIDYETQDFTNTAKTFDLVFDAVGKISFRQAKTLMNKDATFISTGLGKNWENILLSLITPFIGGKKVLFPIPEIKKTDVEFLKGLIEQNQFRPVVDRTFPLAEIVKAYQYVETGQKKGNVVIKVREG